MLQNVASQQGDLLNIGGSRGGGGGWVVPSPGKSQVAIGLLRHYGTDRPREAIGPFRGPIASRGRSVRPSVKNGKMLSGTLCQAEFSGTTHTEYGFYVSK